MSYKYFDEKMTSTELQLALFDYASKYRADDLEDVKREFSTVLRIILDRESQEDIGWSTAYHL